jgi:hypothetical protein
MSTILLILAGIVHVSGQSYSQSALMNKEWRYQEPGKSYCFIYSYTDKEEIISLAINNKKTGDEMKSSYYLSDEVVDKFQANLVGKNKNGKYIVIRHKGGEFSGERLYVFEILELTDTTLKVKYYQDNIVLELTAE